MKNHKEESRRGGIQKNQPLLLKYKRMPTSHKRCHAMECHAILANYYCYCHLADFNASVFSKFSTKEPTSCMMGSPGKRACPLVQLYHPKTRWFFFSIQSTKNHKQPSTNLMFILTSHTSVHAPEFANQWSGWYGTTSLTSQPQGCFVQLFYVIKVSYLILQF